MVECQFRVGFNAKGYTEYKERYCEFNTSCGMKLSIEHVSQVSEITHSFSGGSEEYECTSIISHTIR